MILYLGFENELLAVDPERPQAVDVVLTGQRITSLAVDPSHPDRVFCGTGNDGLWRSTDAGTTWDRVGSEVIASESVLSVAVSPVNPEIVFAGTEPSALYRSDDSGDTWREMTGLQDIPSKKHWSFPPQPDTHHVRWITLHSKNAAHLFVAIEAGALVRSLDGGATWEDRVDGGPIDTHTLCIHPARPNRLLSAAGDGFFESEDRGQSWSKREDGLPYRYCYGLAVDSADPDLVVMSVSPGAHRGHGNRERAHASIVRQDSNSAWSVVTEGLPQAEGTTLSVLTAHPGQPGAFFALNNRGLYHTDDGAKTWQRLDVPWKDEYLDRRPPAIAMGRELRATR